MATVVLFVALRLALGCHFLYEGVWKFKHPDEFAAETEGFLSGARGPLAGVFYAMVPDIDGRQRLKGEEESVDLAVADAAGKKKKAKVALIVNEERTRRFESLRAKFVAAHPDFKDSADKVFEKHLLGVEEYLADNWKDIQTHFEALDRYNDSLATSPGAAFQKKRDWDQMRKLRSEAKPWLAELDARESGYKAALCDLLEKSDSPGPDPFAPSLNPFRWTRMEQIRFAITWGLTAIGACLFLGLGTRPAALGGGLFMMFVVMSQPSFPGVVPADPPQLGHALLVNKDFIEMIALFLVASTAVGRWGGLDSLLGKLIVDPFLSKVICRTQKEG